MEKEELIKELIVTFQKSLPKELVGRDTILPIHSDKIVVVCGIRRCGKSSVLQLTMNELLKRNIPAERILFLNFDDERLQLGPDELDLILQAYRELYPFTPLSDVFIFFDEIQSIKGWEPFVRRVYDNETKNIFITGSNSTMLSSEIASSLRGRTVQYEIAPLSYMEYCRFRHQSVDYYQTVIKSQLTALFYDYIRTSFPELIAKDTEMQFKILQEYYYVMLYRDLIEHYNISNIPAIKYFIRRLMVNVSKPSSINKIYNELRSASITVGKNSLYEWAEYLQSIFLFVPLYKYEPSLVKELSSNRKFYCMDNGLRSTLIHTGTEDRGIMLENQVFVWLHAQCDMSRQLFYYKGNKECDFVLVGKNSVVGLIQVTWQMGDAATYKRKLDGLLEASVKTGCENLWLITADTDQTIHEKGKTITVIPAWKAFLINSFWTSDKPSLSGAKP